jgi:membrane protein
MDAFINKLTAIFPHTEVLIAYVFNMILSFAITSFLFGLIFKVLPDAKIEWRHVRAGAFTTAILFMAGKFGISYYLGHNKLTSAYGAAGSVIVILLWVYYSATILYFGAVYTRVYAIHKGSQIYPDDYAVWIEQVEVESEKSVQEQPEKKTVIDTNGKKVQ